MANILAIVDPDRRRREQFLARTSPHLKFFDWLVLDSMTCGDFSLSWAIHPDAPFKQSTTKVGTGIIVGDAFNPGESVPLTPDSFSGVAESLPKRPPYYDGLYACFYYDTFKRLAVSTDILGLFPIYYWAHGDVILVGTSPELFRHHPLFNAAFNPFALVSILTTTNISNGETLLKEVRRLDAGHLLFWAMGQKAEEHLQFDPIAQELLGRFDRLPHGEQLDLLEEKFDSALLSQLPGDGPHTHFLSGGIDSRLVTAYLHKHGIQFSSLTFGSPEDFEMQCAAAVTRKLGLPHRGVEVSYDDFVPDALHIARWEHLTAGFSGIMDWTTHTAKSQGRTTSGYLLDSYMGGQDPVGPDYEDFLKAFACRGLTRKELSPLLRKSVFGDSLDKVYAWIQAKYDDFPGDHSWKPGLFNASGIGRFHVGSAAWYMSFRGWPVLPVLNGDFVHTCLSLPVETMGHRNYGEGVLRRAEKDLLISRFQDLPRLPVDQGGFNSKPHLASSTRAIKHGLESRWRRVKHLVTGIENRTGPRLYDFNNPGWQAIRKKAEPQVRELSHLFDQKSFGALFSSHHTPRPKWQLGRRSSPNSAGLKVLVGLGLWSKDRCISW